MSKVRLHAKPASSPGVDKHTHDKHNARNVAHMWTRCICIATLCSMRMHKRLKERAGEQDLRQNWEQSLSVHPHLPQSQSLSQSLSVSLCISVPVFASYALSPIS